MEKTIDKIAFGNRLTDLRNRKGLTQHDLRSKLDFLLDDDKSISITTLSNYENGHRLPDVETLNLFSNFYNVSVEYLLYGTTDDIDTSVRKIIKSYSQNDMKIICKFLYFFRIVTAYTKNSCCKLLICR